MFALRDDPQVFAPGIALGALSALLLIASRGSMLALIPLYAIGVFTGFTLSQAGLVVHWRRARAGRWRYRAALNATGRRPPACPRWCPGHQVHRGRLGRGPGRTRLRRLVHPVEAYYRRAVKALGLGAVPGPPRAGQTIVVVPVAGVSRLARRAISEAISISREVIAVTVVADSSGPGSRRARLLREQWARWDPGVPLRVLHTEYASVARPVAAFIDDLREHPTSRSSC